MELWPIWKIEEVAFSGPEGSAICIIPPRMRKGQAREGWVDCFILTVRYAWRSRQELKLTRILQMIERYQSLLSKVLACSLGDEQGDEDPCASDQTLTPPLFQRKRQNSKAPPSCCVCKLSTEPSEVKSFQQTCQSLCSVETDRAYRLRG